MHFIKIFDAVICDAQPWLRTKHVGKNIAQATLKHVPHDTYLAIFREGQKRILPNKWINKKLHAICKLEVSKRGLV